VEEGAEVEISEGVPGAGKCTRRYVTSAGEAAKFLLGQVEISRYIVVIVLRGKKVGVHGVRIEGIPEDLAEVKQITQIGKY
jgi:hypothetical protein